MQSNPSLSANLPVTLVKILVNLLVKLTKLGLGGHGGALPRKPRKPGTVGRREMPVFAGAKPPGGGEYTREKARRSLSHLFPGVVLPDGPPNARGPLEVLVGPSHRFI